MPLRGSKLIMMGTKLKQFGWGFVGTVAALALYALASTAWMDHQRLTALWDLAVQQAQRAAAPQQQPATK